MSKLSADKRLGQHFLHHGGTLKAITDVVEARCYQEGYQAITEIGPGLGALTDSLRPKIPEYWVMEQDRRFTEKLESYDPPLRILWGDTLQQDWTQCPPGILVGNLPYNVSVPILLRWLDHLTQYPEAIFMVQKEVGQRIVADVDSKSYGRLGVMLQSMVVAKRCLEVSPGCFTPPPKVMSWVIHLRRREHIDVPRVALEMLLRTAFSQRRKMLKNTLQSLQGVEDLQAFLASVGASPCQRAEVLTVDQYVQLARTLQDQDLDLKCKVTLAL